MTKKLTILLVLVLCGSAWGQTDTFYIGDTIAPNSLSGVGEGDAIGMDSAQASAFIWQAGANDTIRGIGAYWRSNVSEDTQNAVIGIYAYDLPGDSATDSIYAVEVTSTHDISGGYDSLTGLSVALPTENAWYTVMITPSTTTGISVGFLSAGTSAAWWMDSTGVIGPGFDDPFEWNESGEWLSRFTDRQYTVWAWGEVYDAAAGVQQLSVGAVTVGAATVGSQ